MSEAVRVEADTTIDELIAGYPKSISVFHRHRMHCPACELGRFTTIAEACDTYHQELNGFLGELRAANQVGNDDGMR